MQKHIFMCIVALLLVIGCPRVAFGQTVLRVHNGTSIDPLYVVVSFPPSSTYGCGPTNYTGLRVTHHTVHAISGAPQLGYFILHANEIAEVAPAQTFSCLQGINFCFSARGVFPQCPCGSTVPAPYNQNCTDISFPFGDPNLSLPNGTNVAEVTLNPPQNHALPKAKRYQETADISCNQGAHSILKLKVPPGFTNGVRTATNSTVDVFGTPPVDNNCSISGVSPYNLDNCNGGPGSCPPPPAQAGGGICTSFPAVCQLQRQAPFGGVVTIKYIGPASTAFDQ